MQIGYGQTGTSPEKSSELFYYLSERDQTEMNRDYLINSAISSIKEINALGYKAPELKTVSLSLKIFLAAATRKIEPVMQTRSS